jgi:hypothetical protein
VLVVKLLAQEQVHSITLQVVHTKLHSVVLLVFTLPLTVCLLLVVLVAFASHLHLLVLTLPPMAQQVSVGLAVVAVGHHLVLTT